MVLDAQKMENSPARVLIIDTAWLGDVLFTTALIGAVRIAWPETEIHFLTAPRARELVMNHPDLTTVRVFDKHGAEGGFASIRKLASELNTVKFDLVLNAHPSFRSRLICSMLKAPVKIGHRGFLSSRAFTHTVHNDLAVEPDHVERRLNLLRAICPIENAPPLKIGISFEERTNASEFLRLNCPGRDRFLALVPGSARKTKQWLASNFVEVGQAWLNQNTNGRVLVFLGPGESALKSQFPSGENSGFQIIEQSLRNCAALLNRCDLTLGNDTGVSFLAIAAGCPKVLILYGSTQVNYRFVEPHRAIAAGVPCCLSRTGHGEKYCKWTGEAAWCMNQITRDRVLEFILKQ